MAYIMLPQQERTRTGGEAFSEGASPYLQLAFQSMLQRQIADRERQKQMEMQEMQRQQDIQQATELGLFQPQYEQIGRDIAGQGLKYPQMLQPQEQSKFYSDIGKKKYQGKSVPDKYLKFSPEGAKTLPPGFQIPLGRMQYNVPQPLAPTYFYNPTTGKAEPITLPTGEAITSKSKVIYPDVAREKFNVEQEEKKQKLEENAQSLRNKATATLETLENVKNGVTEGYFGLKSYLPTVRGTPRFDWQQSLNKVLSENIVNLIADMKAQSKTGATGFGQLNTKELEVLTNASNELKEGTSPERATVLISVIEEKLNKILLPEEQQPQGSQQLQQPTQQQSQGNQIGRFIVEVE